LTYTVKYLTGNVKNREAVQAGLLLGPVAGGALVAATRAPTVAFAVDAASFGISALTFWLIRRSPESRTETTEPEATGDPQAAEGSRK
jgi:hypothetical protein